MLIDQNNIKQDDLDAIETLIDRYGMAEIMLALVHITGEKAEHIRTNWHDDLLANDWDNVSHALISERMTKYLNRLP